MTLDTAEVKGTRKVHGDVNEESNATGERGSILPSQAIKMAPHGFELLLVAGVSYISWGIGVPIASVLHHAFFAIGTIAAVHCVDAFRTMSERITQLGELEEAARKIGIAEAPESYRLDLKKRKLERARYGIFTAFNCFCWVCGAVTYTLFIKIELALAAKQAPPFEHLSLNAVTELAAFFSCVSFVLATYKVYRICETPADLEIGRFADYVLCHLDECREHESFRSDDTAAGGPKKPR